MFNSRLDGFVANFQRLQTLPVSDPLLALIKKSLEPHIIVMQEVLQHRGGGSACTGCAVSQVELSCAEEVVNLGKHGTQRLGTNVPLTHTHTQTPTRTRTRTRTRTAL